MLGEHQESQSAEFDRPGLPLTYHRFFDIETRLSIMYFPHRCPFDSSIKQLDPSEVYPNLLLSSLFANLLPVIHKIVARLLRALTVLELLVALADIVLHVGELWKCAGLRWFCS